jgi:hypothetical protein
LSSSHVAGQRLNDVCFREVIQKSCDPGDALKDPTLVHEPASPVLLPSPKVHIQPAVLSALTSTEETNPLNWSLSTQRSLTVTEALARFSNRALPPLPPEAPLAARNMIVIPRDSTLAGRQSPSVRDLRARSVVSNRVAAMQALPSPNGTPPALSTRTQQLPRIASKLHEETPLAYFRPQLATKLPAPNAPICPPKEHDVGVESVLESYCSHSPSPSFAGNPRPVPSPSSLSPSPSLSHTVTTQRSSVVSSWCINELQTRGNDRETLVTEVIRQVLDALDLHALSHETQAAALGAQIGSLTKEVTRIVDAVDGTLGRPKKLGDDNQAKTPNEESRELIGVLIGAIEDLQAVSMLHVREDATPQAERLNELLKEQGRNVQDDIAEVTRRLEELKETIQARPEDHQVVLSRLSEMLEIHRAERLQNNSETRGQKSTWTSNAGVDLQVCV